MIEKRWSLRQLRERLFNPEPHGRWIWIALYQGWHAMLFSYLIPEESPYKDDVFVMEAPLECFDFDRPMVLADELHIAGAVAFATAFGFSGVSLLEWALVQTLGSPDDDNLWDDLALGLPESTET